MYVYDVTSPNLASQAANVRLLAPPNLKLKKFSHGTHRLILHFTKRFSKKSAALWDLKLMQCQESTHLKISAPETPLLIL
jgi:hypothetical protein